MNIQILPKAKKELKRLPQNIAEIILRKIFSIKDDPLHYVERLKRGPLWKLRIGDYRSLMVISTKDNTIYILKVGHRKDIYKDLP